MKNKFFLPLMFIVLFQLLSISVYGQMAEYRQEEATFPDATTIGVAPGVMVYSGDVDEVKNNLGVEAYCRFPLKTTDDAALYCALGYSMLEGGVEDANTPSRTFTTRNPFTYALFMPSYKVNSDERIAVWLKAGIGAGYLKSANPKTEGTKLLVPLGIDFNYHFSERWMFTTTIGYMLSGGDLDGLKRGDNPDYREKDHLINVYMGFGFIP